MPFLQPLLVITYFIGVFQYSRLMHCNKINLSRSFPSLIILKSPSLSLSNLFKKLVESGKMFSEPCVTNTGSANQLAESLAGNEL